MKPAPFKYYAPRSVAEALSLLAEHGYDPKMGARPMARLIQQRIKKPLAEELLFGKLELGGHLKIRVENELAFDIEGKAISVT